MLVLSRRVGESLKIGDSIVVRVVYIGGNGVKLGIEAPKETLILRSEVMPRGDLTSPSGKT